MRRLLFILFFLIPLPASAIVKTVEIEFAFTSPEGATVTGYNVYTDGNLACSNVAAFPPGIIDCTSDVVLDYSYAWTLSAVYDDATESPASPEFAFTVTANGSNASAVDSGVTLPAGEICIDYVLTNIIDNATWSSVDVGGHTSRVALYGILNNQSKTFVFDDPSARQLCWSGVFPNLGTVKVQLATYRGSRWVAGSTYDVDDEVTGDLDNYYYVATVAGTAGGTAPTWPTTVDAIVVDGGVTWQCKDGANNWVGNTQRRKTYLKNGESLKKSSTHRMRGNFGLRSN